MNLDNTSDFNKVLSQSLGMGMLHVAGGAKTRVSSDKLITLLSNLFGDFGYRRFHQEILSRAYGLAFVNAKKMKLAKRRLYD